MDKLVHKVGTGAGMHPAGGFIKPLIDKELSPGRGPVGIQTLFTDQVVFTPEEKTGVRVDQQQRVATGTFIAGNSNTIGTGWLLKDAARQRDGGHCSMSPPIEPSKK